MESQYINSRPFRVNAGAVHAYVQAPNGRTAYLSELKSGAEVLVVDATGRARTSVVGRCKIETRPMVGNIKHLGQCMRATVRGSMLCALAVPGRPSLAASHSHCRSDGTTVSALAPGSQLGSSKAYSRACVCRCLLS